jgi:hypothetical protein
MEMIEMAEPILSWVLVYTFYSFDEVRKKPRMLGFSSTEIPKGLRKRRHFS